MHVADRFVEEAGADSAIGFDHGRDPGGIAAGRNGLRQAKRRPKVENDPAELLGTLGNESRPDFLAAFPDQRFDFPGECGHLRDV